MQESSFEAGYGLDRVVKMFRVLSTRYGHVFSLSLSMRTVHGFTGNESCFEMPAFIFLSSIFLPKRFPFIILIPALLRFLRLLLFKFFMELV